MTERLCATGLLPRTPPRRTEGRLRLVFSTASSGRSFLSHQFASYPFHVCRVQYLDPTLPEMASLYLQSCAGGLFAGDRLNLNIDAEAQTKVHVTTQASTIVYRTPDDRAQQEVQLTAAAGSFLEFLPDPVILFPHSHFSSTVSLRLERGATALLSDSFMSHDPDDAGQAFGCYESALLVQSPSGRRLALDRFRITGQEVASGAAGLSEGFATHGTLLVVSRDVDLATMACSMRDAAGTQRDSAYVGVSTLPNDIGVWARVLAEDGSALAAVMTSLWTVARSRITGHSPGPRRK